VDNLVYYDQLGIHICYSIFGLVLYGRLIFLFSHLGDTFSLCVYTRCMQCTIFHCVVQIDFLQFVANVIFFSSSLSIMNFDLCIKLTIVPKVVSLPDYS
jgi:hypothetical protein